MIYDNQDTLISALRKKLKEHGTFTDVAAKLGITPQDLNKIFLKTWFTFDDASKLLKAIGNRLYITFLEPGDEVMHLTEQQKNLLTTYESLSDIQKAELRGMLKGMLK